MTEIQNKIVGIVGRKGSGKSSRLSELCRFAPRLVIFDVMSEHAPAGANNRFETPAQQGRFLNWSREQPTFACTYVPQGDLDEEIEEVSRLVYARGNLCFVCEEVPLYTQAGYMPPLFGKLVRTGRHKQIDICWTAQRAAEVSKTLTALTDVWILFSQVEPRDLDALASRPLRARGGGPRRQAGAARLFRLGRDRTRRGRGLAAAAETMTLRLRNGFAARFWGGMAETWWFPQDGNLRRKR